MLPVAHCECRVRPPAPFPRPHQAVFAFPACPDTIALTGLYNRDGSTVAATMNEKGIAWSSDKCVHPRCRGVCPCARLLAVSATPVARGGCVWCRCRLSVVGVSRAWLCPVAHACRKKFSRVPAADRGNPAFQARFQFLNDTYPAFNPPIGACPRQPRLPPLASRPPARGGLAVVE